MVANEWLDNIPCHVVEVDDAGVLRMVHVDPATGTRVARATRSTTRRSPPRCRRGWTGGGRWTAASPGTRAEVGTTRDAAWADVVGRVTRGIAVAVDYGHTRRGPAAVRARCAPTATGHEVDVLPDGSRDVTAHVAVDAVADRVGGVVRRQRDALRELGVDGSPPRPGAGDERPGRLRAGPGPGDRGAAELTAEGGLGDFCWVVTVRD